MCVEPAQIGSHLTIKTRPHPQRGRAYAGRKQHLEKKNATSDLSPFAKYFVKQTAVEGTPQVTQNICKDSGSVCINSSR